MHVCTCLVQACCTTETKRESKTSTVASSLATYFGCFVCVCEKKVRARLSFGIELVFDLRVFASLFS